MKYLPIDPEKIAICLARAMLSRKEMCQRCGITEANMSTIIKRQRVSPVSAGKIAKALGVDVTEIMPDRAS